MRKILLIAGVVLAAGSIHAQDYIKAAPAGGFKASDGKDYVILYAPESLVNDMGNKITTNNNLDPDQVKNTLEYWVTDWDPKDLTLYNVPAKEGEVNSFGTSEFINATPIWAWGTGVFMPRSQKYDLSKVTNEHHIHIGLRDFGSAPSKYQFSIGSQKTIKNNGFMIMAGIGIGEYQGDYSGIGNLPNGNDGKWYYIDIPVADLVDPAGEFGYTYNFANPIADGAFTFSFYEPITSEVKKSGPSPGNTVYDYEITKLGSALSLDHIFFYIPSIDTGVEGLLSDEAAEADSYYTLQGIKVQNPTNGIYIVKNSNGARKVLISK